MTNLADISDAERPVGLKIATKECPVHAHLCVGLLNEPALESRRGIGSSSHLVRGFIRTAVGEREGADRASYVAGYIVEKSQHRNITLHQLLHQRGVVSYVRTIHCAATERK